MRRNQRNKEHNQHSKQKYLCVKCGSNYELYNHLKVKNPEHMLCDFAECDGHMIQEGKPEEIAKSLKVKPGQHYLRYMNLEEETEVLAIRMMANQLLLPEEQRASEKDLKDAAEYHAKENTEKNIRGISIDVVPLLKENLN